MNPPAARASGRLQQRQEFSPAYRLDHSATADSDYVMNHCVKCGAKLGDHFMHNEPDGPFYGDDTNGLDAHIVDQAITVEAAHSEGALGEWLHARFG